MHSHFVGFVMSRLVSALVYVMDSSERPSLENVQKDIQSILNERDLYNTPVLIVATKQDIEGN